MARHDRRVLTHSTVVRLRRFATVGTLGAVVQTALLWALVQYGGLHYLLAAVLAIEYTIVQQYVLNNSWTFRPSRHRTLRSYVSGLLRTNVVRGTSIPIQAAILFALVAWAGIGYLVANLLALGATGFYRYYLDSRWTWKITLAD